MTESVSIAIETSCRAGGLALGRDGRLVEVVGFDTTGRHATQLVSRLDDLLTSHRLRPGDLTEVYVSAGPGSFTGLRVGITAARTLAQTVPHCRCVAVPTAQAIAEAENVRRRQWRNLAVVLDARQGSVYATFFRRCGERIVPTGPGAPLSVREFLDTAPRPLLVVGQALEHQPLEGPGITTSGDDESEAHLPTAECIWRVGRRMAKDGQFTDYHHLLPIYARKPEAVRLWEDRARQ